MFIYRARTIRAIRKFASRPNRMEESDDDLLFSNDGIQSTHVSKSNTPFRRALRVLWRIFSYSTIGLFGYTYYQYKTNKDYMSQALIYPTFVNAAKWTDDTIAGIKSLMVDPPLDKLLPDLPKMPPGYPLPKTLVLDLKGTIISTEYVFGKGYVIMKRPGLTEFLNKMSQMYEVVILCEEETMFMSQLTESLDPNHRIFSARMGRECLCYRDGEMVKDLKYLNRDLKNVVILEKTAKMVRLQEDNAILLPEFNGDKDDKFLIEIMPFLEHLVKDRVQDVREEIKKYGHSETGKKYLERLQRIRDNIVLKQNQGFGRLLVRKPQQKATADLTTGETPKPPGSS